MYRLFLLLALVTLPASVLAAPAPASFLASETPLASTSVPGNSYIVGNTVVITAPTQGDLVVLGGSIVEAGDIKGDGLFLGGTVSLRAPVAGDVRVAGGNVAVNEPIVGDLVAVGYKVDAAGRAGGSVFIAAANASMLEGAAGPVIIYANNVLLQGDFAGDVSVVAGGMVRVAEGTRIRGVFSYEAPDVARIHESAVIEGGVQYKNASYLPDAGASRALAVASIGIFLLVRIIGALILAGLLAGLFPRLAEAIVTRATDGRIRRILLTTLLGFATIVATPILLILLAVTFIGIGIAVIGAFAYALLLSLAVIYAGIMLGVLLARRLSDREQVVWHDGVLGMLLFSLIALIPIVGWVVVSLLVAFCVGALLVLFFRMCFPQDDRD